jgi:mannose-6-phosphate isomerase-like protein (cupin superfamily)
MFAPRNLRAEEESEMAGKVVRITKDSTWIKENIPYHENYRLTPMVSPKTCPGAQIEFYIGEYQPVVGRAVDHAHVNEDHIFYILSGHGTSKVGDEIHSFGPGDVLWVPKGEVHNTELVGDDSLRVIAIFSPARST